MGIAAMASAKTSVVLLSDRVAPRETRPYWLMLGSVAAWTVFATFATAFQCSVPRPWVFHPSLCPSHGNLQYPIIIFNVITDAILATWILPTLRKLLMDTDKRATVMVLFGSRLLYVLSPSVKANPLTLIVYVVSALSSFPPLQDIFGTKM